MLISLHSTCDGLFFFFNEAPECSLEACLNLQVLIFGLKASLVLKSEKAMAIHSSTLAWKVPWMEEPGGLQSLGSHRVGHNWATSLSLFTFMHWRRKWQSTPVFLPGESQRREPGGLPSMGSHRVGYDWRDLAAAAAALKYSFSQREQHGGVM